MSSTCGISPGTIVDVGEVGDWDWGADADCWDKANNAGSIASSGVAYGVGTCSGV